MFRDEGHAIRQTERLLRLVADRLSGREDCKKVQFKVTIDHNGVSMVPLVYVFPNRYRRCEKDKIDIISYVHRYKLKGVALSDFIFGTYEYQLVNNKRRRWIRV